MQHLGIAHQDILCDEGVHWRRETEVVPGLKVLVEARQVGGLHCQIKLLLQKLPAGCVRCPGILNKLGIPWYRCAGSRAVHRGSTAETNPILMASLSAAAAKLAASDPPPRPPPPPPTSPNRLSGLGTAAGETDSRHGEWIRCKLVDGDHLEGRAKLADAFVQVQVRQEGHHCGQARCPLHEREVPLHQHRHAWVAHLQ